MDVSTCSRWRRICCLVAVTCLGGVGCRSSFPMLATSSPYTAAADHSLEKHDSTKGQWKRWGEENLQSGDIVFGMGDARAFFGLFRFSKITSKMAGSRYSHTGLISREEDGVYVYDMAPEGARRLRFEEYVLQDKIVNIAIKRPDEQYRPYAPEAVRFCQEVYRKQPTFDRSFRLDDDSYYCTELTAQAYKHAGVDLCEPIRVDRFPNYAKFPLVTFLGHSLSPIQPSTRVFTPGNSEHGLWSCAHLELVYEKCLAPGDPSVEAPENKNMPLTGVAMKTARPVTIR